MSNVDWRNVEPEFELCFIVGMIQSRFSPWFALWWTAMQRFIYYILTIFIWHKTQSEARKCVLDNHAAQTFCFTSGGGCYVNCTYTQLFLSTRRESLKAHCFAGIFDHHGATWIF